MRFAPAVERLHGDQVDQAQARADLHRLLVMGDRQVIAPIAPGHRSQVIQRVGDMTLIAGGARRRERFVQAGDGRFIGIGTAISHAELNQHVSRMLVLVERASRLDHPFEIGDCTFRLACLRPRHAPLLIKGHLLRLGGRIRMGLQQCDSPIQPLQRFAHGKKFLRVIRSPAEVMDGFGPDLSALIVFRKMGIALMGLASRVLLEQFRHHPVQQHAPGDTDVPVHHLAHLVMAEIVEPTFLLLAQQPAPDQCVERMQKTFLWRPSQRQQRLEVETTAQHRCKIEQWSVRGRHARQAHPHGITYRVWQRQAE